MDSAMNEKVENRGSTEFSPEFINEVSSVLGKLKQKLEKSKNSNSASLTNDKVDLFNALSTNESGIVSLIDKLQTTLGCVVKDGATTEKNKEQPKVISSTSKRDNSDAEDEDESEEYEEDLDDEVGNESEEGDETETVETVETAIQIKTRNQPSSLDSLKSDGLQTCESVPSCESESKLLDKQSSHSMAYDNSSGPGESCSSMDSSYILKERLTSSGSDSPLALLQRQPSIDEARTRLSSAIVKCKSREKLVKQSTEEADEEEELETGIPEHAIENKALEDECADQEITKRKTVKELPWKIRAAKKRMEMFPTKQEPSIIASQNGHYSGIKEVHSQSANVIYNSKPRPYHPGTRSHSKSTGNISDLGNNIDITFSFETSFKSGLHSKSSSNIAQKGDALEHSLSSTNLTSKQLETDLHIRQGSDESGDSDVEGEVFSMKAATNPILSNKEPDQSCNPPNSAAVPKRKFNVQNTDVLKKSELFNKPKENSPNMKLEPAPRKKIQNAGNWQSQGFKESPTNNDNLQNPVSPKRPTTLKLKINVSGRESQDTGVALRTVPKTNSVNSSYVPNKGKYGTAFVVQEKVDVTGHQMKDNIVKVDKLQNSKKDEFQVDENIHELSKSKSGPLAMKDMLADDLWRLEDQSQAINNKGMKPCFTTKNDAVRTNVVSQIQSKFESNSTPELLHEENRKKVPKKVVQDILVKTYDLSNDPSELLFTPEQLVQIAIHKAAINKQLSAGEQKRRPDFSRTTSLISSISNKKAPLQRGYSIADPQAPVAIPVTTDEISKLNYTKNNHNPGNGDVGIQKKKGEQIKNQNEQRTIERKRLEQFEKQRLEQQRNKQRTLKQESIDKQKQEELLIHHSIEKDNVTDSHIFKEKSSKPFGGDRLKNDKLDGQRLEQDHIEHKKHEEELFEHQKSEKRRVEQEWIEQKKREEERPEQKKREEVRLEYKKRERQKLEQERAEHQKREQQRVEQERLKKIKIEEERLKQIQIEEERLRQIKIEEEHLKQIKIEEERLKQIKIEEERLKQIKIEEERLKQLKIEEECLKQLKSEEQRLKKLKIDEERLTKLKIEQECLQQKQLQQTQLEKQQLLKQRLEQKSVGQHQLGQQPIENQNLQKQKFGDLQLSQQNVQQQKIEQQSPPTVFHITEKDPLQRQILGSFTSGDTDIDSSTSRHSRPSLKRSKRQSSVDGASDFVKNAVLRQKTREDQFRRRSLSATGFKDRTDYASADSHDNVIENGVDSNEDVVRENKSENQKYPWMKDWRSPASGSDIWGLISEDIRRHPHSPSYHKGKKTCDPFGVLGQSDKRKSTSITLLTEKFLEPNEFCYKQRPHGNIGRFPVEPISTVRTRSLSLATLKDDRQRDSTMHPFTSISSTFGNAHPADKTNASNNQPQTKSVFNKWKSLEQESSIVEYSAPPVRNHRQLRQQQKAVHQVTPKGIMPQSPKKTDISGFAVPPLPKTSFSFPPVSKWSSVPDAISKPKYTDFVVPPLPTSAHKIAALDNQNRNQSFSSLSLDLKLPPKPSLHPGIVKSGSLNIILEKANEESSKQCNVASVWESAASCPETVISDKPWKKGTAVEIRGEFVKKNKNKLLKNNPISNNTFVKQDHTLHVDESLTKKGKGLLGKITNHKKLVHKSEQINKWENHIQENNSKNKSLINEEKCVLLHSKGITKLDSNSGLNTIQTNTTKIKPAEVNKKDKSLVCDKSLGAKWEQKQSGVGDKRVTSDKPWKGATSREVSGHFVDFNKKKLLEKNDSATELSKSSKIAQTNFQGTSKSEIIKYSQLKEQKLSKASLSQCKNTEYIRPKSEVLGSSGKGISTGVVLREKKNILEQRNDEVLSPTLSDNKVKRMSKDLMQLWEGKNQADDFQTSKGKVGRMNSAHVGLWEHGESVHSNIKVEVIPWKDVKCSQSLVKQSKQNLENFAHNVTPSKSFIDLTHSKSGTIKLAIATFEMDLDQKCDRINTPIPATKTGFIDRNVAKFQKKSTQIADKPLVPLRLSKSCGVFRQSCFEQFKSPPIEEYNSISQVTRHIFNESHSIKFSQILKNAESCTLGITNEHNPVFNLGQDKRRRPQSLYFNPIAPKATSLSTSELLPWGKETVKRPSHSSNNSKAILRHGQFEPSLSADTAEQKRKEIESFFKPNTSEMLKLYSNKSPLPESRFQREQRLICSTTSSSSGGDSENEMFDSWENLLSGTDYNSQLVDQIFSETLLRDIDATALSPIGSPRRRFSDLALEANEYKGSNKKIGMQICRSKTFGVGLSTDSSSKVVTNRVVQTRIKENMSPCQYRGYVHESTVHNKETSLTSIPFIPNGTNIRGPLTNYESTFTYEEPINQSSFVGTSRLQDKGQSAFDKFKLVDPQQPGSKSAPKVCGPLFTLSTSLNRSASGVKDMILTWCQCRTRYYKGVKIENFSTSWNDGMAFCALIHHFYPDAFDFASLDQKNRRYNFTLAFRVADEKAGVFPLLDVEDMVIMKKPDWKCVFTYVQALYKRLKDE